LPPSNRGRINSTHIRGTHVPVEEPSTASEADMTMERAFSTLRRHNATRMFSTENVVVEVRNPLLTRNGGVKVYRGCI
jgi:hypothetical protein